MILKVAKPALFHGGPIHREAANEWPRGFAKGDFGDGGAHGAPGQGGREVRKEVGLTPMANDISEKIDILIKLQAAALTASMESSKDKILFLVQGGPPAEPDI